MNKPCLPWKSWFLYGVSVYHLSPEQFWQLSVCEWNWLLSQLSVDDDRAVCRERLDELLKLYPDGKNG